MSVQATVPDGTPTAAPPAPVEAPAPVSPPAEAAPATPAVTNPDVESSLRDLSFLVDESDLPPAGQRSAVSARLQAMLTPTPADGQSTATIQPQPAQTPIGETAQQKAERLWAQKYKTPEELERGYLESQKLMTEKAMEYANLRQSLGDNDPRVIQDALLLRQWYHTVYEPWRKAQESAALQQKPIEQPAGQPTEETAQGRPKSALSMTSQELLEALSDNPKQVLTDFFQAMAEQPEFAEKAVPELAQSRAAKRIISEFTALEKSHPDAVRVLPTMDKLYKQYPSLKTQYPMEAVYMIAKGVMFDELEVNQQQAIQNAAAMATKAAYENQQAKLHGTVEGTQSIEPGASQQKDDIDELMNFSNQKRVRAV